MHLLSNCPNVNVGGKYVTVNIDLGNGLVSWCNKPLPELILTQMFVAIWRHTGHNGLWWYCHTHFHMCLCNKLDSIGVWKLNVWIRMMHSEITLQPLCGNIQVFGKSHIAGQYCDTIMEFVAFNFESNLFTVRCCCNVVQYVMMIYTVLH